MKRPDPWARRRARLALAGAGLATTGLLLLTGCVGTPAPPPVTVVVTQQPDPSPSVAPVPTQTPRDALPPEPAPIEPNAPAQPAEPLPEGPAFDLGPRDGALGSVVTDGDGNPLTYTVVAGDVFFDIAQRFDLPQQQLLRMNPSIPGFGLDIYIGDIVNLDWTTTR
ncbi:LysM peptidoglycan-binding domain-containing protein [Plantibacter flavus]|uniref:LysM peptidoglycan-binding domain-containing protein n=1 Tax=Plantibacter flavus TaxID=150123 RepID=UPI003F182155